MPPKGGKQSAAAILNGRGYKEAVNDLFENTAVQPRDIDQKAVQLLDALHKAGKASEACEDLKAKIDGIPREKVNSWKAYVYSLLRGFDKDVYTAMKEKSEGNRGRGKSDKSKGSGSTNFNTDAVEFVPGSWWGGTTLSTVPMFPMPVVMYPGAPPPPAEPAAVTIGEAKEVPVPEGSADASAPSTICMKVSCETVLGETVAIAGSISELGSWAPEKALKLSPDKYPVWESPPISGAADFEYKFLVLDQEGKLKRWEEIGNKNRTFTSGSDVAEAKFGAL